MLKDTYEYRVEKLHLPPPSKRRGYTIVSQVSLCYQTLTELAKNGSKPATAIRLWPCLPLDPGVLHSVSHRVAHRDDLATDVELLIQLLTPDFLVLYLAHDPLKYRDLDPYMERSEVCLTFNRPPDPKYLYSRALPREDLPSTEDLPLGEITRLAGFFFIAQISFTG